MSERRTIHFVTCPIEPHFHFHNDCPIACLYNSNRCKHGCIQLGSSNLSETKSLSPSEILFYKAETLAVPTIKSVMTIKKEATLKIQTLYTFNYYLDFIRTNYFEERMLFMQSNFLDDIDSSRISNILNAYPFNIKLFKIVPADLVLLLTESYFKEFCSVKKVCSEITYLAVLGLREIKIHKARKVLQKYLNRKGITHDELCKEED